MELRVDSLSETNIAAREILQYAGDEHIWVFYGEMGAGKTTLIKAIARQLNIEDNVHSPTFSIVNEYRNLDDDVFYHFDFYRIEKETEALDIGVEEYFDSGDLCLIEWPQKIESILPDKFFKIEIDVISDNSRKIKLSRHGN